MKAKGTIIAPLETIRNGANMIAPRNPSLSFEFPRMNMATMMMTNARII